MNSKLILPRRNNVNIIKANKRNLKLTKADEGNSIIILNKDHYEQKYEHFQKYEQVKKSDAVKKR